MLKTHPAPAQGSKVLLALSGGVDSAVCAWLLQQQGYEVHALFILFSSEHQKAAQAARLSAKELGIPLHVADARQRFEAQVLSPFCHGYMSGRTPNPCILCNPSVKFYLLTETADALHIPYVATGHYAQIRRMGERCYLARAQSAARDQSYMLYRLGQPVLCRLLLPLGLLEKSAVRALAAERGLACALAPDSQEICFIETGNYAEWMQKRGFTGKEGCFIAPDGTRLGAHRGTHHYTVGQRRHLGVSLGRPAFVKAILPCGDIRLAFSEEALAAGVLLKDVITTGKFVPDKQAAYTAKIRSMARQVACRVTWQTGLCQVCFETPQPSPAPGQHTVLYQGDLVVGGGEIDRVY